MSFYADLHVHSKYSRATSRECNLEHLSVWARRKGLAVLGTGDITHPGWRAEVQGKLIPAESGLFRLRAELDCEGPSEPTRFMLTGEVATVYKKDGRSRRVHHVIGVPGFEQAECFAARLGRVGKLESDGRPMLGLDSRDLLEIVLEAGDGAWLMPAHVWTPWYSVLGSKSGFDSMAECYGDLAGNVFAVETGLSSDPPMNWRVSSLDPYRLVSNSDAHSPSKLGREACVFECPPDYFAMLRALKTGEGYGGTVEFYPEEGKYHLDGHRKCRVRLTPDETRRCGGACPVCGRQVTVGVMHRVEDLADRGEGARPAGAAPFRRLIPLEEVLSEVEGVAAGSKRVGTLYAELLRRIGPELFVLEHAPLSELARHGSDRLAEGVRRMRSGEICCEAGFDGEYGALRLFP